MPPCPPHDRPERSRPRGEGLRPKQMAHEIEVLPGGLGERQLGLDRALPEGAELRVRRQQDAGLDAQKLRESQSFPVELLALACNEPQAGSDPPPPRHW